MKNYFVFSVILGSLSFFLSSSGEKNIPRNDDLWTGDVHYEEKRTGPDVIVWEWHMDAQIKNNQGTANNYLKTEVDAYKLNCTGVDSSSYLEVSLDDDAHTYSIFASVPGCKGTKVLASGVVLDIGEDETGIMINNQPMGNDPKTLRGRLILRDTADKWITHTTYTWFLTRSP